MRILFTVTFIFFLGNINAQNISFNKSTLRIEEPYKKDQIKKDTFSIELKAEKIPSGTKIKVEIQKSKASTYPDSLVSVLTQTIDSLGAKNTIKVAVTTDVWSDEDEYLLLTANWKKDGELSQLKDTLFIKNAYPFKGIAEKDYTDWNDGKRAEIFIGSNFDLINSKVTLSDWYGGARVFLPSITDLRYNRNKSNRIPRFGISGGIYHAKSLSNFGNPLNNTEFTSAYGRVTSVAPDSSIARVDTVRTKVNTEINNWGLYFTPLYQWSRFESSDGKFITNIYLGIHCEVIRRNISTTYSHDTINYTTLKYRTSQVPRYFLPIPLDNTQTYYDTYWGICLPVQFLWKDILDLKVNPCIGVGARGYTSQIITKANETIKKAPAFYLVQFDLLARLGGIRLNIGGEVRGYFPNENPIITAYLGTSFSIQKLVDIVAK